MNLRNTWAVHTVRTLLALALLAFGGSGLYFILSGNMPVMPTTPAIDAAAAGFEASGIIIAAKIIELITGLMLLVNFRSALATLLLAPVMVGIMIYDVVLYATFQPAALIPAVVVFLANIYLGYVYWDKYKSVFEK